MQSVNILKSLLEIGIEELARLTEIDASVLEAMCEERIEPTVAQARDLATVAGVSAFGLERLAKRDEDDIEQAIARREMGFWGHLRVHIRGFCEPLSWPVSGYEAKRISGLLSGGSYAGFLEFDTLDGRSVQLRPSNALSVRLEAGAADLADVAARVWAPPEVYRAIQEWREDAAAYEANNSLAMRRRCLQLIDAWGWAQDREALAEHLHVTKAYHTDTQCLRITADRESLADLNFAASLGSLSGTLVSSDSQTELHLCLDHVVVLDMPLNDLLDGRLAD